MGFRYILYLLLAPKKKLYYINRGHYTLDIRRAFIFSSREVCLDIQKSEKDNYGVDVQIERAGV